MADLPSLGSNSTVGVLITTRADDGAIKQTQAELTTLGESAATAGASAASSFENFNAGLKRVGSAASALGHTVTTFVTLPIVGLGFAAAKSAMDFQQAMTYIRTDAGDTTDDITKLGDSVLDLARKSQFGPEQLAQGLYHLASLGLRGADAINALNTAQQMASVGGADLESTASALGAALVTGIKGVQDYSSAAGVLDATIGAGNMRMQDLVTALGTGVLPVFKNAGLSITDFGAALATLTDNGQDAAAAATHLRMTVALMEAPSQKAAGVMNSIGLASNQLGMDMQTKGLIPALDDLKQHLLDTFGTTDEGKQKMAAALTEMFGGGRSSSAIQTLIDQLDRVNTKEQQITQQSGEFATKVAEQQQTAAAKFQTAWSRVQADFIKLGAAVLPEVTVAMTQVANAIDGLTNWFDHLSQGQKQFVVDAALVVAAIGPALIIFGTLATSINNIITLTSTLGSGLLTVARVTIPAVQGAVASLSAYAGSPAALLGWGALAAGAVVDIMLIYNAIQTVQGALNDLNAAQKAKISATDQAGAIKDIEAKFNAGKITKTQETNAINAILKGVDSAFAQHATGANYARGGWSMVGENGPEAMYVPQGATIKTNPQTNSLPGAPQGFTFNQTNHNYSMFDLEQANRELSWRLSNAAI